MKSSDSNALPTTGERFLPEFDGGIVAEHQHRYRLAQRYVEDRVVLDIACGEGYGSHLLAESAARVIGVDIDADTVAHARAAYPGDNLEFLIGDCAAIPLDDASVDVVVSFETIEHHDRHQEMLAEIRRVLRPGGLLIISSPDHHEYSVVRDFDNPYHVRELSRDEFATLLGEHFAHHALFGQRVVYGSLVVPESREPTAMVTYGGERGGNAGGAVINGLDDPMYWIALASDAELPTLPASCYRQDIAHADAVIERQQALDAARAALEGYQAAVDERDARIAGMNEAIDEQSRAIEARDVQLETLQAERERLIAECERLIAERDGLSAEQARLEDEIARLADDLAEARAERDRAVDERQTLESQLVDLNGHYFRLQARAQSPGWLLKRLVKRAWQWPSEARRARDERRQIAESGLFDAEWYRQHNPDVHSRGLDPLAHYQRHGGYEGRAASADFDTASYLRQHPELIDRREHPLLHYLRSRPGQGGEATHHAASGDRLFPILFEGAAKPSEQYVAPTEYALDGDTRMRAIAFYLPQFHPIAENDRWWGKGFTEWTNVSKAVPQFVGHEQPRLPGELGFYDLRIPEVQERQVELARQHGIEAFCFHYYWFSGRKRLLERPIDQYVANPNIDFPFCLCWANENWTRRWDGQENDVLMEQRHEPQDDLEFIEDIAPLLEDPRYLRVDGKPVLIVYRVDIIPDAARTARTWREFCRERGIGELHLVCAQSFGIGDPEPYGFDAAVEFPPHALQARQIEGELEFLNPEFAGRVYDYRDVVASQIAKPRPEYRLYPTVFPAWDNEARKPGRGHIFHGANPGDYRRWLDDACRRSDANAGDGQLVFINAWNEWAEGAYLEPDRRHGYAFLRATQEVLAHYPAAHAAPRGIADMAATPRAHDTAVILHLYYPEMWQTVLPWLRHIPDGHDLFVTLAEDAPADTEQRLAADVPGVRTARVPNRGRDIAPFLEVLRAIRPLGYAAVCKVHAKKSLHRSDGEGWRDEMFQALLGDAGRIAEIQRAFADNPELGLVGPAGHWLAYPRYWGIHPESPAHVHRLLETLGDAEPLDTMHFFAGSMFWCRPEALDPLLKAVHWGDFEHELAQTDGALGHAVERILARAVQTAGFRVTDSDAPARLDRAPRVNDRYGYAAPCPPPADTSADYAPRQWSGAKARLRQIARQSPLARRLRREILSRIG
ncbi:glycoside hydrolase family 99-like domain-containing protein [Modicisalibacter sp. MOD 31.J]|uniref:glycoside hydrolase family 99-like domain-containing protein n=1 Tax=Modicisalibacter sp. MOD 31.J TaxID=2831897 RepID=UPI001CCF4EF2|nr:glycoside hydrolase family 99-like domain-containing protein [Modicisalibacter sp. MOD 31.J]MBZ9573716.1 glycoside hydrolase family 99-like domain-containing protein [Modicisalibacter sp. MOD 31.J]